MKQYQDQPDNSNWVDKSPVFDVVLKICFSLCILSIFITKTIKMQSAHFIKCTITANFWIGSVIIALVVIGWNWYARHTAEFERHIGDEVNLTGEDFFMNGKDPHL